MCQNDTETREKDTLFASCCFECLQKLNLGKVETRRQKITLASHKGSKNTSTWAFLSI